MTNKTKFKETEIGLSAPKAKTRQAEEIPKDWELKKIGDEIELCYGKGLTRKKRILGPYPVFGSNGIVDSHSEYLVKGPGIIIGRKGSVGEVKFSKKDFWPIDTTYYVKLKDNGSIIFWYYFLLTLRLNKMNSHSAVPGLNREMVYELAKKIPDYNEQKAIAKILSDLDSKIELNNQMNKTLEAIGQALFKRWFVDFEPIRSSDWQVDELDKHIEFIKGKKPDNISETYSEGYKPQLLIENLNGKDSLYANKDGMTIVGTDEPIMVMDGASSGRVEIGHDGLLGSTLAKVITVSDRISNLFLYYFLKSKESEINQNTTGTSIPHVDKARIKKFQCVLPPKDILKSFDKIALLILNKVIVNKKEIKTLSQVRDSLLPRLMSGRIRVGNR